MKKLVIIGMTFAIVLGSVGCTAIEREMKTLESNTKGLHRKVDVIAMDGSVVRTYESENMIVTDGDGGTIILDFEGKRVTLANSQAIIEEVSSNQ